MSLVHTNFPELAIIDSAKGVYPVVRLDRTNQIEFGSGNTNGGGRYYRAYFGCAFSFHDLTGADQMVWCIADLNNNGQVRLVKKSGNSTQLFIQFTGSYATTEIAISATLSGGTWHSLYCDSGRLVVNGVSYSHPCVYPPPGYIVASIGKNDFNTAIDGANIYVGQMFYTANVFLSNNSIFRADTGVPPINLLIKHHNQGRGAVTHKHSLGARCTCMFDLSLTNYDLGTRKFLTEKLGRVSNQAPFQSRDCLPIIVRGNAVTFATRKGSSGIV